MTFGTLADDIILRIYKGMPTDDIQLEKAQIIHWLAMNRDMIVKDYLNKTLQYGKAIDMNVVTQEKALVPQEDTTGSDQECNERFYVTLAAQPLSLFNDMGVFLVEDEEGIELGKSRTEMRAMFRNLRYAKGSPLNLNWFRLGDRVFIEGINDNQLEEKRFTVLYVGSQDGAVAADTIKLGDDMIPLLVDAVEELARRQMLESKPDIENNGVEDER